MAPAGVPQPILDKISKDWAAALKTSEMQARLKSQFVQGVTDTPAAFDKIIADETANLTAVFKEANIGQ
jgi:tripartite-type tricarboxylate transporter receptor subunit TctC